MAPEITGDTWIHVPKWEEFQHYKNRHPSWIKVYTRLLHDPRYLSLSSAAKGVLQVIWLSFSEENGRLSVGNLEEIQRKPAYFQQLVSLNDAGFIQLSASKLLAATSETEKEKEPPYPHRVGDSLRAKGTNPRAKAKRDLPRRKAEAWINNGLASQVPADQLADVISDEFGITDLDLLHDLVNRATERKA